LEKAPGHRLIIGGMLFAQAAGTDSASVTGQLNRAVAGLPSTTALDRAAYQLVVADDAVRGYRLLYTFLVVAVVTAALGLATTLSMAVAKRTREFAILRSMGAPSQQVRALVRWEGGTIVLFGTVLGTALAEAFRNSDWPPAWWT
jgi:putative ABC transport system permease protein